MRNKKIILSTIFLSSLIIVGSITRAQGITKLKPKQLNYKVGSPISIPELKLSENTYVSDYKYIDITGDKVKDNVILTGMKMNKDDIYFENLSVIVQNGKTKEFIKSSLGKDSGAYEPRMFLGDFNGDKAPDIFLKMPTWRSGGFIDYSIIDLKGNNLSVLWDSKKVSNEIDLTGKFEDNFIARLSSKKLDKTFQIDLSPNKVNLKRIFTQTEADVNGDGLKDYISLTGISDLNLSGLYVENICLEVYDSKTNKVKQIPVSKNNSGYTSTLFVTDLNNDKAEELFVTIPSGGSGGMKSYSLISLKGNKVTNLFDEEKFSYGLEYDVEFKDGFKVDVNVKESNKIYSLEISSMKDSYINFNVYNSDGKLMQQTSGMRNPLSNVEVKTVDGKYQLISYQRVIGTSNAETLGDVQGTWDIQQNGIKLVNVEVVKP